MSCVARHRESPKTAPKPRAGPAFEQHLLVVQQQQPGGVPQRNDPPWSRCRQLVYAALAPRHAAPPHRAHIATRLPCADGRAEIHQRLRVDADVVLGKQALCEPPQLRFDFTLPGPAFDAVAACEHALDVAVENRSAAAEGERRDRRGARAPDARNLLDLVYRIRESAAVLGDELSSGPMQVARAGIVAEAAPEPQHLVLVRRSERPHVGKAGQEALVVGNDRRHLRLLQHHFREPDAVRIPHVLPGKPFAPVTALPSDEKACESRHARILMGAWAAPSSASANTTASWRRSGTTCTRTPSWGSRRPVLPRWWRTSWKYGSPRSEEHTSELQSLAYLVCRLLLEKKKSRHVRSRYPTSGCRTGGPARTA